MTTPCIQTQELKEIRQEINKNEQSSVLHNEKISRMQEDITDIKEGQIQTNAKIDALMKSVDEKFERLERKFASKWVEWVVKGIIGIIGVSVFGAIVSKVIVK